MTNLSVKHRISVVLLVAALFLLAGEVVAEQGGGSLSVDTDAVSSTEDGGKPNYRFFNLRLGAGIAFGLGDTLEDADLGDVGGQGFLGFDFEVSPPLAFSILGGYNAFTQGEISALQDMFLGAGLVVRLFPDLSGPLTAEGGNAQGHLWIDAHLNYHSYEGENHGGYNVGVGYELAMAPDFNVGPYMRFQHTPMGDGLNYAMLSFGLQASLGGRFEAEDTDGDGVLDKDDKCPDEAEDLDGFNDEDGCLDADNDQDGIPDVDDKCPDVAENVDGVADDDGCPEDDTDHDGIKNDLDQCPEEAEDKDGFEDDDGCPDLDDDGDGIVDANDRCPEKAEDKDGFEDEDGCPDPDNDGDGKPDHSDQCPNEPETFNDNEDEDGCPDLVRVKGDRFKLLMPIAFGKKLSDVISDESMPVLDEIAAVLKVQKNVTVRIEGHTANKGDAEQGRELSGRRAQSVLQALVERGIDQSRLTAAGVGPDQPLGGKSSADERIELLITGK